MGGLPVVGRGSRRQRRALEVVRRPGLCTTCAVLPLAGGENLTPPTRLEKFTLATWWLGKPLAFIRGRWKGRTVRLACQTYVRGPVEVVGLFGKKARRVRAAHGLP